MEILNIRTINTPVGEFDIIIQNNFIIYTDFSQEENIRQKQFLYKIFGMYKIVTSVSAFADKAARQFEEYFAGTRHEFDLPTKLYCSRFQAVVYENLLKIPYGETWSYKQLAEACNSPKGFRAVGGANNKNPIGVLIPCHRVIGANGALTGYAGGLSKKQWLLEMESGKKQIMKNPCDSIINKINIVIVRT